MKLKTIFKVIGTCLIVTVAALGTVQASENTGSDFLIEIGNNEKANGNLKGAIHEWSKALMLDPTNEEAKRNLREAGLEEGLYSGAETHHSRIADMSKKLDEYKYKVAKLEKQKEAMEVKLGLIELENRNLANQSDDLYEANMAKEAEVLGLSEKVMAAVVEKDQAAQRIAELEGNHNYEKHALKSAMEAQRNEMIKAQLKFLEQSEAEHAFYTSHYDEVKDALAHEDTLAELTYNYQNADAQLAKAKASNDNLMNVVEDYLYVRSSELEGLKNQYVASEIELTESQVLLLSRLDQILGLHDEQDALRKRVDLRDQQINELLNYSK